MFVDIKQGTVLIFGEMVAYPPPPSQPGHHKVNVTVLVLTSGEVSQPIPCCISQTQ